MPFIFADFFLTATEDYLLQVAHSVLSFITLLNRKNFSKLTCVLNLLKKCQRIGINLTHAYVLRAEKT